MFTHLLQNGRYGRLWGLKYEKGVLETPKIVKIPGVLKRGMWQFDCTDKNYTPAIAQLDNGNQTNLVELQKLIIEKNNLLKARKNAMEFKKTAEAK